VRASARGAVAMERKGGGNTGGDAHKLVRGEVVQKCTCVQVGEVLVSATPGVRELPVGSV